MRSLLFAFAIPVLLLAGCATPQSIMVISEQSQEHAVRYQKNMTTALMTTADGYRKSERRYHIDKYNQSIKDVATASGGRVRPEFVEIMTKRLVNKLETIDGQVRNVQDALVAANVDFERYLAMQEVIHKYLLQAGLQPEHLQHVRSVLTKAGNDFIKAKQEASIAKLQAEVSKLGAEIEANRGNEEFDAAAVAAEMEKKRRALELLKNLNLIDEEKKEGEDE